LSRITEPTTGSAQIRGRVGSLLEVGTGFHPELTGRENVYLNGAILGMTKREIDSNFDEIVDFAEIDRFIDTPVKRYSSGMSVRLAFAVAAHLQPEILLIDEVLSVGDAAFQRKCLGKMEDVAKEGRTIVFVSHNLAAVQNLCTRGVVIREGRLIFDGPAPEAVSKYLEQLVPPGGSPLSERSARHGDGSLIFTDVRVMSHHQNSALVAGQPATFEFTYENRSGARRAQVIFTLFNHLGVAVANFDTDLTGFVPEPLGPSGYFRCRLPALPLPLGEYRVAVAAYVGGRLADLVSNASVFRVDSSTFFATGRTPDPRYSACMIVHEWEHMASVDKSVVVVRQD
jgi:lipopolysaccharide transport system ATP-binding protein